MENREILVHISAPSGASDDARYRAQVEAILGFQSVSHQNISIGTGDATDFYSSAAEGVALSTSTSRSGKHEKTLDSDLELHRLHGTSLASKGNKDSPSVLVQPVAASTASESSRVQGSCSSGSPQGPKSMSPVPPASVSNQTWKGKSPQKQCSPLGNDSLGTPISVIPDSQPAGPDLELVSNLEYLGPQPQPSTPNDQGNSLTNGRPAKRRRAHSPTPENRRNSRAMTRLSGPNLIRPSKKSSPPKTHHSSKCTSSPASTDRDEQAYIQFATLPLTIRPPPPPVSTNAFSTHITPTLELLANRLKPSRIYKPTYQTRDLDKLERGHWFLRINVPDSPAISSSPNNHNAKPRLNDWDIPFLSRVWTFLSSFIAKESRAGWGAWCILQDALTSDIPDKARPEAEDAGSVPTSTSTSRHLVLKVYTWGEVACHIYLLLFLASERRIRKMGAEWRDAREEVVVQMP